MCAALVEYVADWHCERYHTPSHIETHNTYIQYIEGVHTHIHICLRYTHIFTWTTPSRTGGPWKDYLNRWWGRGCSMAHLPRGPPVHPAPLYQVQGYHGITYHLFIFNMMIYRYIPSSFTSCTFIQHTFIYISTPTRKIYYIHMTTRVATVVEARGGYAKHIRYM